MENYIRLGLVTLLPVTVSLILFLLDKKTRFGKLPYILKQIIFGLIFGGIAVFSTEFGIPINGAQMNVRDGAVLCGGLLFGAPAGIIAGLIGGIERWIAVAWGVGSYTRVACTVSTIVAGLYAAFMRKFLFEDKKPSWFLALASGIVIEVFHMTMVFLTNISDPTKAMQVVEACSGPMISANALCIFIASIVIALVSKERLISQSKSVNISQTIQKWMLICVVAAFVVTSAFMYVLQTGIADEQSRTLLTLSIQDVYADIAGASDRSLLNITKEIGEQLKEDDCPTLNELARKYDVTEISIIQADGVISESTNSTYVGFDMKSGEQSLTFLNEMNSGGSYVQEYGPITYDENIFMKYAGVKLRDGYVQVGYSADRFQDEIAHEVLGQTENRHVGQTGFILISNRNDTIVSGPKGMVGTSLGFQDFELDKSSAEPMTPFSFTYGEIAYRAMYADVEGFMMVGLMPMSEVYQLRNIAMYANTFMEILVFAVLFAMIYMLIRKVVVKNLQKVNDSLVKITGGNLDEVVNVRSNAEFASLSDDINSTVATLKHYIDEAAARIDKELEFAKNIQSSALPSVFPAFPQKKEFDIYALMDTAKEVGGDFYDFYMTNDKTLNFLIADVSGKGIPAAMFMMRAKSELKGRTETGMPVNEVFINGNNGLCEGNDAGMFVTAWQGNIDLDTGHVNYANAGHNPPVVKRADGTVEYLRGKVGLVLAGMEGVPYKPQEFDLNPGDMLYLYTDGVTEATDKDNQLFGEDRLQASVAAYAGNDPRELCEAVKRDVDAFVGDAPQFDDITMVALRFDGQKAYPSIHFDEASIEDIPAVTEFLEGELEKLGCSMKTVMQMNVALDEIYSNIVKFAYGKGKGPATVTVTDRPDKGMVSVTFTDEGTPYNPLTQQDPDVTLSAEERGIGGLGIYIVKNTMDDLQYKYENDKNIFTITKKY